MNAYGSRGGQYPTPTRRLGRGLLAVFAAVLGIVALATPAFAAGTPYGGGGGGGGGTGPGGTGGGTVVTTCTVTPTAVTVCTAKIGADTITITVPANVFTNPTQIVVTDRTGLGTPPQTGATVVISFGVTFAFQGTKITGSFAPVGVAVTGPDVAAGQSVYFGSLTGNPGFVLEPSSFTNGSLNFSITSDPAVEVTSAGASSGTAVTGATAPVTGKPFGLEGIGAGVLVVGGSLLLFGLHRRRRST
jgi:hypothetical protein